LVSIFVAGPPGNYAGSLGFSTAVTGTLFFIPTADFFDDPPSPTCSRASTAKWHPTTRLA
jgi:putative iron-dependent peroxidase